VEDLNPKFRFVVVPEGKNYTMKDGIKVCNLSSFLKNHLHKLK
jgi:hypothetical protein